MKRPMYRAKVRLLLKTRVSMEQTESIHRQQACCSNTSLSIKTLVKTAGWIILIDQDSTEPPVFLDN